MLFETIISLLSSLVLLILLILLIWYIQREPNQKSTTNLTNDDKKAKITIHYIENIGDEELHFTIFFSHEKPQDIGISGAFGSYSNEVLGAVFYVNPRIFESLPKYQEDLLVVAGGG
jgi:hypothetical protein